MVTWRPFAGPDSDWDAALAALPGANPFQSSAWARHKADSGWRPVRAVSDGAAVQALIKDLPGGARLLWARGGPVGSPDAWGLGLRSCLKSGAGGNLVYGRVCSYREADGADERALWSSGWSRPARPLDRNMTYLLDLVPGPEAIRSGLSSNWGHNARRAEKRVEIRDWTDPDPSEMEAVYLAMESYKGLGAQHRAPALASLVRALGPALILKRAVLDGRTVGLRACAVFAGQAVDLLAAADAEGRKVYASYGLLLSLLLDSRRAGARAYDLGGADPDAAKGVADFKKGTGARLIETLGEWDFAYPDAIRSAAGELISWKLGRSS